MYTRVHLYSFCSYSEYTRASRPNCIAGTKWPLLTQPVFILGQIKTRELYSSVIPFPKECRNEGGSIQLMTHKCATLGCAVNKKRGQNFNVTPLPLFSLPPPSIPQYHRVLFVYSLPHKQAGFWRYTHLNWLSFISKFLLYIILTRRLLLFTFAPN